MASEALDLRRSVHKSRLGLTWRSSWLPGVHLDSQAFWTLRWTMPRTILGEVAS
jgi:hypothetical protein